MERIRLRLTSKFVYKDGGTFEQTRGLYCDKRLRYVLFRATQIISHIYMWDIYLAKLFRRITCDTICFRNAFSCKRHIKGFNMFWLVRNRTHYELIMDPTFTIIMLMHTVSVYWHMMWVGLYTIRNKEWRCSWHQV